MEVFRRSIQKTVWKGLWQKDVSKDRVERVQDAGLEVWVTPGAKATVDVPGTGGEMDRETYDWLVDMGVDAVLVNDVEPWSLN